MTKAKRRAEKGAENKLVARNNREGRENREEGEVIRKAISLADRNLISILVTYDVDLLKMEEGDVRRVRLMHQTLVELCLNTTLSVLQRKSRYKGAYCAMAKLIRSYCK